MAPAMKVTASTPTPLLYGRVRLLPPLLCAGTGSAALVALAAVLPPDLLLWPPSLAAAAGPLPDVCVEVAPPGAAAACAMGFEGSAILSGPIESAGAAAACSHDETGLSCNIKGADDVTCCESPVFSD